MQGYVAACANMVRDHGYQSDVSSALGACMKDEEDLIRHGVDETDIEVLRETIESLKRKRALNV